MTDALNPGKYHWYFGKNEEYLVGREDTRDAALAAGVNDYGDNGFYLICARIAPVDVACHFDIECLSDQIDECDDYLSGDGRDTVFEDVPKEDMDNLQSRIRAVILVWQCELQAKGIHIIGDLFTSRNPSEWIAPQEKIL